MDVTGLNVTLKNPLAGVLGVPNAIPTTVIATNAIVTLAGALGATGAAGASGGASSAATYIVRTPDASVPSATALNSFSSGYLKTQGSSGSGFLSTVATVPVGDISGVLPVANGGTNLSTVPTNGQLLIGNGTGYTLASLTAGSNITITPGAGTISIASTASGAAFNYVTFTRRVTGLGAANAPNVSSTSASNPYSTSVYTTASYAGLDSASGFTASSGRFTVPYTGYYRIDAYFNLDAVGATANVTVFIRRNGSDVLASKSFVVTSSGYNPVSLVYIDQATALTDFYEVLIGTDQNLYVDQGSSFSVQRIQA
jgi:hypothetical protein